MTTSRPPVTIGLINYNGAEYISTAIQRTLASNYENVTEIIFLDNASQDDSLDVVAQYTADVRVICNPVNQGPAGARNRILEQAQTDLVLLLDLDSYLTPEALDYMVDAYLDDPENVAVVHPRIVFEAEPDVIQYDGAEIHYVGVATQYNRNARVGTVPDDTRIVHCLAGNVLISKKNVEVSGWYDEAFFFGFEDADFSCRATLAGKHCLQVSRAIIRHGEGTAGFSMREGVKYSDIRAFHGTKNRLYFVFKLYAWRTLFVIAPALLFYECTIFAFMVKSRNVKAWARGWWAFLKTYPDLMKKRRAIQQVRTMPDREFLHAGDFTYAVGVVSNAFMKRAVDFSAWFFKSYWRVVRPLIG